MKPILFNTEMVKIILAGRKTVTRRLIKPQPYNVLYDGELQQGEIEDGDVLLVSTEAGKTEMIIPPYSPGDVLYVRETFVKIRPNCYYYKADEKHLELAKLNIHFKWCPSIHMPKEAARIFLRVTDVRVERLQNITDEDLLADFGAWPHTMSVIGKERVARIIWNSTIKKSDLDKYGWDANPWVFVISFERISKEEIKE